MEILNQIKDLAVDVFNTAVNFNWRGVNYRRSSLIGWAAVLLTAVFLLKVLVRWWRRKEPSFYLHSGLVFSKGSKPGIVYRLVRGTAWIFVAAGMFFLGLALSDPVFYVAKRTEQVESREIVYLRDASASMGFRLQNSNVSRGEATQEFILKLLTKRKDLKDRAAYIVFGTESEIWSSFTTSFNSFVFSISNAPIAIAPSEALNFWKGDFILKKGQWVEKDNGGGTSLHLGLQSAIYLFDRKGLPEITQAMKANPGSKMRSVVIITDGAADTDPEPQFIELRKRGIIPYLVFIDPAREIEKKIHGENSTHAKLPDQLLSMVKRYGGEHFMVRDLQSADKVSEAIDRLQSVKKTIKISADQKEVYYIPLEVSFFLLIGGSAIRFVLYRFWRIV